MKRHLAALLGALSVSAGVVPAAADPLPRTQPIAGAVIARKSGEEIRFVDVSSWKLVDLSQDVVAGDYLRTNATGNLAVLFADRTQMRLGRNTTLLVKNASPSTDAEFSLEGGTIWARAARGGLGLTVETPAAAAAIRGTDWTMSVDASGKTSLTVLEGTVELSNPQGSVTVGQGEGAVAAIGQAPTRIFNVNPDDREQMLYYLSLRDSFGLLAASPLSGPDMRAELRRIDAIDPDARTADDWLTLAEVSLIYRGRAAAIDAASQVRRKRLDARQQARLTLVDGLVAGAEKRFDEADALLRKASAGLDRRRRVMALFGAYYARALADPDRIEKPPSGLGQGPYAAIAEALTAGFLLDVKAAIAVLKRAERLYPDDPTLPAIRAQFALVADDRDQMHEALDRSLALDPDEPTALKGQADYLAGYKSDIEGAYRDLSHALEVAPGAAVIWNAMALVQIEREGYREGEEALLKAIELDPEDPLYHANLGILYLEQDRLTDAKREIDLAVAGDPAFDVALIARGRYFLQKGEVEKARDDLLAGTTANPAYAQGLLLLAAANLEAGDRVLAEQALDNADRLDPNDPAVSSFRTVVAIDEYEADSAIRNAQEALRRTRARGGDYSALNASRDAGSTLNSAFRLAGLDAWGRYYGAATFDPFAAGGYIDQAVSGSADPFVNSLRYGEAAAEPRGNTSSFSGVFQGLLLDPQLLATSSRRSTIVRTPFVETSIGGGLVDDTDKPGRNLDIEIQGYQPAPIPWSIYAQVTGLDTVARRGEGISSPDGQLDLDDQSISGTGYIAAKPTPYDRVVAYVDRRDFDYTIDRARDPLNFNESFLSRNDGDVSSTNAGLAWSHTFGRRNVGNAALFVTDVSQKSHSLDFAVVPGGLVGIEADNKVQQRTYIASASHSYGIGNLTMRYGLEGGAISLDTASTQIVAVNDGVPTVTPGGASVDVAVGRAFFEALYEVTPQLQIEGGLFGTYLDGGVADEQRLEPRAGIAWEAAQGQYLRAGFLREASSFNFATLAPVGVVGLQTNQAPLSPTGYSDTFAARWEAEWTPHLFTAVDYQHQNYRGLSIDDPVSAATLDLDRGRVDRLAATANVWIGGGLSTFATVAYSESENRDRDSVGFGGDLPFVPRWSGRAGVTFVHPSNVKLTVAGSFVGARSGDETGARLHDYWTLDSFLTWEPLGKSIALELAGYNLLDEAFEVAPFAPGWGRSVVGTLKVRF